jgi:hypothetical protein
MDPLVTLAADTLRRVPNAAIATVSPDGHPWNSPLFVALDETLVVYWSSHNDAIHSINIASHPQVFIVIFDSIAADASGHAVYIPALARELTDETSIADALKVLADRKGEPVKSAQDFLGPHPRRVYRADPSAIWTNVVKQRDGHYLDVRVEIDPRAAASLL